MLKTLYTWPAELPSPLESLYEGVAAQIGATDVVSLPSLANARPTLDSAAVSAVLVVPDAAVLAGAASGDEVAAGLTSLGDAGVSNLVVVVGDGYLGTDVADLRAASSAAAAISTVRSLAVRRTGQTRANAVCIPERLVTDAGSQRGPMRIDTDISDIVNAASFLLDASGGYLSGQVLFADGGRHLFSSMSA